MSYPVLCPGPPREKIIPKDHCLGGRGNIRLMTTQKHDFYKRTVDREKGMAQPDNLKMFAGIMSDLTTTGLSYRPNCVGPTKNCKPEVQYAFNPLSFLRIYSICPKPSNLFFIFVNSF